MSIINPNASTMPNDDPCAYVLTRTLNGKTTLHVLRDGYVAVPGDVIVLPNVYGCRKVGTKGTFGRMLKYSSAAILSDLWSADNQGCAERLADELFIELC